MSTKRLASWPRLCKWLRLDTFFDAWFLLLERSRAALHQVRKYGLPRGHRWHRRRTGYLPQLEGMELRLLMTTPTLSFVRSSESVHYNASDLVVSVLLSPANATATVTVKYSTSGGTAVAGTDFTGISNQTLTFLPGHTQENFTVAMLDHKESSNVNFSLQLSSPSNAALGSAITDGLCL